MSSLNCSGGVSQPGALISRQVMGLHRLKVLALAVQCRRARAPLLGGQDRSPRPPHQPLSPAARCPQLPRQEAPSRREGCWSPPQLVLFPGCLDESEVSERPSSSRLDKSRASRRHPLPRVAASTPSASCPGLTLSSSLRLSLFQRCCGHIEASRCVLTRVTVVPFRVPLRTVDDSQSHI